MSDAQPDPNTRPVIRLKPAADARAIRHGAPWVYSDALVLDRRTRALAPGTVAVLEDVSRSPLALVAVTPESRIAARVLDADCGAEIDKAWFLKRLQAAVDLRDRLFAEPYYRLVHAEADGLPGVVIDRFGATLVIQPNAAWADVRFDMLADAALEVSGAECVILNGTGRARKFEGLPEVLEVARGVAPDGPVPVPMNGATYMADLMGGQKTGLFYDQRGNHAFTAGLAKGARVLDVFSHVGGFALAALAAGAESALAVDGSQPALELAEAGAEASGVSARFSTRKGDAFATLEALSEEGAQFDVVICDPPAFAPSKKALTQGLRAYERVARLAAPLVAPGGILTLCSCSHAAEIGKFGNACARGIGRAGRSAQLLRIGYAAADHPTLPQLAESGYLKALTYRLLP
ncbi:class I SAM-dependent rRNA methyltransferase [Vannielia litorea]|uniref:RSP_2647 family RNA methyltransferase n=1 Tax=Vannielia litorea TaxID=1217970 RepID=UPI001C96D648|nr:class I SAM-dependent rRNA methyltransferase [Vannielia litorea]MBY6152890.1 class I SAM-dependent rRNA methyltransferase [Vannielia litorea]